MAQIPAQPLRALANFVRDGLANEATLTADFVAVVNELCDLAEKTALIEEGRVIETFAETSSLLLLTFQLSRVSPPIEGLAPPRKGTASQCCRGGCCCNPRWSVVAQRSTISCVPV